MKLLAYLGLCMIALFSESSSGARFPNAVEKKIIVSGENIKPFVELFRLQTPISLRLGRSDAWAVYLLKLDTKEKLLNSNGSPPRYNRLTLLNQNEPVVEISPYWLDLSTSLPNPEPYNYMFSSSFISGEINQQDDPWNKLVHNLKNRPEWKSKDNIQFQQCYFSREEIVLCLKVFKAKDYESAKIDGHIVVITADLSRSRRQ